MTTTSPDHIAERIVEALESLNTTLQRIADGPAALGPINDTLKRIASGPDARERENQAIGLMMLHGANVSAISRELGVDERTLRRYSRFMRAIKARRSVEKKGNPSWTTND